MSETSVSSLSESEDAESRLQRLIDQREQLQTLASELTLAEERERRRIARGLHDHVGQSLAIARGRLGDLLNAGCPGELTQPLQDVAAQLDRSIKAMRSLIFELASPILHELGLEAALEDVAERIVQQSGMKLRFSTDEQPKPLASDKSVVLFRATREVLFNVTRHARARSVRMAVERRGDRIKIHVQDDGVGTSSGRVGERFGPSGGFGLYNVRRQMNEIGGRFDFDSTPGAGVRVGLEAPLDLPADSDGAS